MTKLKKIFIFILWVIFILIMLGSAVYLILMANGYKINYNNFKIEKTGMIYLKSAPADANVFINDGFKSNKTPYKYVEIFPGRYEVKISKPEYIDWSTTFNVESGLVSSNNYIKLFLVAPVELEPTDAEIQNLDKLALEWQPKGLVVKNESEIWFNDVLITRFSYPVKKVTWHTDLKHIFFQINKEIRVMEPDGSNNTKLIDLGSDETSTFAPQDNGKQLLYRDGETVKKIRIQ